MYVDANDTRPPSVLGTHMLDSRMAMGGALGVLAAHLGVPVVFLLGISLLALGPADSGPPPPIIEEHVVEARLVRKGKKPDPKKLPQRKVPRKTTAPDKAVAVSKDMEPEPPKEKPKEPPKEAEVDDLMRLGDRAQAFSEIVEDQEVEGDPDGIEDGTETEARDGDIYAGKLVAFFKRGWTIPTTLGDTRGLLTVATVVITQDLRVGASKLVKSSNVPLFDQSVEDRFAQLRAQDARVPEPPESVAHKFVGRAITVRFNGRGAQ